MFPTFELFGKTIGTYMVTALLGVFAAGLFSCRAAKKRGHDENNMIVLLLVSCIGVLLGSHVLFALTNWNALLVFFTHLPEIIAAGELVDSFLAVFGGSVFYGGLLGGMAAGFLYARCGKKKLDLAAYTDMIAPAVPLFHMFGRIGCFLGGCCYGVESDFGIVFEHSLVEAANGVRRFPVQLVEAGFNLLLFVVLAWLLKKGLCKGKLFLLYLLAYSAGRFVLEFWRGDAYRGFLFGVSTSQWISILLFVAAGCALLWQGLRAKKQMQPASEG